MGTGGGSTAFRGAPGAAGPLDERPRLHHIASRVWTAEALTGQALESASC